MPRSVTSSLLDLATQSAHVQVPDTVTTLRDVVLGEYMSMGMLGCACIVLYACSALTMRSDMSRAGRVGAASMGVAYVSLVTAYVRACRPCLGGTALVCAAGLILTVALALAVDGEGRQSTGEGTDTRS